MSMYHSVSDDNDGGKLETSSNTAYGVVTASQEPEYEVIELQRSTQIVGRLYRDEPATILATTCITIMYSLEI